MKGLRSALIVFILFSAVVVSIAQKEKSREDDRDIELSRKKQDGNKMRGTCSCRDMEAQIDYLDQRLDRMIDLWNDFVDKNREPGYQIGGPGGTRGPGRRQDGRGPYFERDKQYGRGPYFERERDRDREPPVGPSYGRQQGSGGRGLGGRGGGYMDEDREGSRFRF